MEARSRGWPAWMTAGARRDLDAWNRARIEWRAAFDAPSEVQRRLALSMIGDSDLHLFLGRLDRMAARRGLEIRLPFYDRRVLEVLFRTPSDQRGTPDGVKGVLREAMREILPETVRQRHTTTNLGPWLREMVAGPHHEAHRALLASSELEQIGLARRGSLIALLGRDDPESFVDALNVVALEEALRSLRAFHGARDRVAPSPSPPCTSTER